MERIMITIPSELLSDVDSIAKHLEQNRSQFIRKSLAESIERIRQKEFEELMAEGYRETSKENAKIVAESSLLSTDVLEGIEDE